MKRAIYIIVFLFVYSLGSASFLDNQLFKGEVGKLASEGGVVWINTDQGQLLVDGQVLYAHDKLTDETKAILKVKSIQSNYILASVIEKGRGLVIGDKVNTVYKWDAYRYEVELNYKKGDKTLVVIDELIIDSDLAVLLSLFGNEKGQISGTSIKKIVVTKDNNGGLGVRAFVLDNSESLSVDGADIDLRRLAAKRVLYNPLSKRVIAYAKKSTRASDILFTSVDLRSINIVKRLNGANLISKYKRELPYEADGDNYKVVFKFSDIGLGIKALESRIKNEEDPAMLEKLASNIRLYSSDRIEWVGLAASFNDWDETKGIMEKQDHGSYELSTALPADEYEYYFVIAFKDMEEGENILLPVLDPYSNRLARILDLDLSALDSKEGEEAKEGIEDIINSYDFIFGYEGHVSVIEVPGMAIEEAEAPVVVTEEESEKVEKPKKIILLPYDPKEIAIEEEKVREHYAKDNVVIIDGVKYYLVTFRFNQLHLLPLDIKKRINQETKQERPSKKQISSLERFLLIYDENKVDDVSVLGSFGNHSMLKGANGVWEAKLYIPVGRHWYHFAVTSSGYGENYYINDAFADNTEKNEDGELVSVIELE